MLTKNARRKLLEPICDESVTPVQCHAPHQATVNGSIYEIATDGHVLLALQSAESDLSELPTEKNSIREWLSLQAQKMIGRENSIAFCEFIKLYKCEICPACNGNGGRDGIIWDSRTDDWFDPESLDDFYAPRNVLIDGEPINANLLAKTMNGLRAYFTPIGFRRDAARFTFYGNGWIVVQIGLNRKRMDDVENLPKWDEFSEIESETANA